VDFVVNLTDGRLLDSGDSLSALWPASPSGEAFKRVHGVPAWPAGPGRTGQNLRKRRGADGLRISKGPICRTGASAEIDRPPGFKISTLKPLASARLNRAVCSAPKLLSARNFAVAACG
jgi:hypothetical protein